MDVAGTEMYRQDAHAIHGKRTYETERKCANNAGLDMEKMAQDSVT
jgi:hypothetical protein